MVDRYGAYISHLIVLAKTAHSNQETGCRGYLRKCKTILGICGYSETTITFLSLQVSELDVVLRIFKVVAALKSLAKQDGLEWATVKNQR